MEAWVPPPPACSSAPLASAPPIASCQSTAQSTREGRARRRRQPSSVTQQRAPSATHGQRAQGWWRARRLCRWRRRSVAICPSPRLRQSRPSKLLGHGNKRGAGGGGIGDSIGVRLRRRCGGAHTHTHARVGIPTGTKVQQRCTTLVNLGGCEHSPCEVRARVGSMVLLGTIWRGRTR